MDALWVVAWWLGWLALAVLYQPLATRVLGSLGDGGWAGARTVGLGVSATLCWLAASLGVAPFSRATALVGVLLPALVVQALWGGPAALRAFLRRHGGAVVAVELVSGVAFLLFVGLRAIRPEAAGLEKFMDYGLAAAASRATTMPPTDMWYAGEPVNYYYFGHYLLAFASRATGVPLPVAYNLMIAQVAALTAGLGFTVAAGLARLAGADGRRRAWVGGLLGASLVVLGGNLHGFVYGGVLPAAEALGLRDTEFRSRAHQQAGTYWYSDATRFIGHNPCTNDKLIHEFPFYAFLVADLHGHVSALPWVLTLLALLLASVAPGSPRDPPECAGAERTGDVALALGAGLLLGILRMTNTWDVPIYGGVLVAWLGARAVTSPRRGPALARALAVAALAAATAWALSLPFGLHFQQHYGELFLVKQRSPLWQLAVLWGLPVLVVGGFALGLGVSAARARALAASRAVWLALAACALGLLVVPEIVAVRDIYPEPYERGNTYFKLTFQAFVLLSLLVASVAVTATRGRGAAARTALAALVLAPLFWYAPLGVRGHYGHPRDWRPRGLDALAFLEERRPGERAAVAWLLANAPPGAALLEADGDSYTQAGRISMATGLPTVLGWYVHEWLWRGGTRGVDDRRAQVRVAYELPRLRAVRRLFERYGVRYVVIGELERRRFPGLDEAGLEALGHVAFEAGTVRIVEVARRAAPPEGGYPDGAGARRAEGPLTPRAP